MGALATLSLLLLAFQGPAPKTLSLDSRVLTPDGKAAPNVRVVFYDSDSRGTSRAAMEAKTDADGRFHFDYTYSTDRWPQNIAFLGSGYALKLVYATMHPFPPAIELGQATTVRVRFLTPSGQPAAGLAVAPGSMGENTRFPILSNIPDDLQKLYTRSTNADGWVELQGIPREVRLRLAVDDARYVSPLPADDFVTGATQTTVGPVFHLVPGGTIRGEVTGIDGKPASGIAIIAMDGKTQCTGRGTTDGNGEFSIGRLAAGSYTVSMAIPFATLPEFAMKPASVAVDTGKVAPVVHLALSRGGMIVGTVLDSEGEPPAWALVADYGPIECGAGFDAATDKQGHYAMRVPAGDHIVSAISGGAFIQRQMTVKEGETMTFDFTVEANRSESEFRGRVLDANGKPVAGAWVDYLVPGELNWNSNSGKVSTDQSGFFDVRADARIQPKIRASKGDGSTLGSVVAEAEKETVLHLSKGATVSVRGRVIDSRGKPVVGASVCVLRWSRGEGRPTMQAESDSRGGFRLGGFYPDEPFSIIVVADGYGIADLPWMTPGGKDLRIPPIRLRLSDSDVRGHVMDENGKPVVGARITLSSAVADLEDETGSLGRFRIEGVPKGKHLVTVRKGASLLSATVEAGRDARLVLPTVHESTATVGPTIRTFRRVGKPAPELQVSEWFGTRGRTLKGRVVVLDFWAFGNDASRRRLPELGVLASKLRGLPVTFIGVHEGAFSADELTAFLKANGMNGPVAIDLPGERCTGRTLESFGFAEFPAIVVIDKEGRIAAVPNSASEVEAAVRKVL